MYKMQQKKFIFFSEVSNVKWRSYRSEHKLSYLVHANEGMRQVCSNPEELIKERHCSNPLLNYSRDTLVKLIEGTITSTS